MVLWFNKHEYYIKNNKKLNTMFKKLVGNLPFNPSLIGQVSFYAKRMRAESAIRRTGVILLALGFFLQTFAVLSPPSASLQASPDNDLVVGGITGPKDAASNCTANTRDYRTILSYYGISCTDLANSTTVSLKSTDIINGQRLYSMGHLAYGKAGETPVSIPGAGTLYLRYLSSWDTGSYSTYKALKGKTKEGLTFFILYNCGNLVFIGIPVPPKKCPYNSNLLASDAKCFEPCPVKGKETLPKNSPSCFEPCPYNKAIPSNSTKCFEPCPVKGKETLPKNSPNCFEPCVYNSSIPTTSPDCKPCEAAQTKTDKTSCLVFKKSARNVTQNIANADGTTAAAGDTIEYILLVTNNGKDKIDKFVVQENISDVLDYADLVNLNGGTLDTQKNLSWPAQTIGAKQTIQHSFTVKIKNPIPSTPISSSDPGHFDLQMTNVYGNTTNIKLPPSTIKTVEIATQKLPNTGPGESLAAIFAITMVASYLFARSRTLSKELDIVRTDFAATGGF
jgi:uncharacterized repeat protein (TIGR01451 family)